MSQPKRKTPGYQTTLKGDGEPFYVDVDGRRLKMRWEVGLDADGERMWRLSSTWEKDPPPGSKPEAPG